MLAKDQVKAECARQRTEWEDKHLGGYRRIYPTPDGGAKYRHLFEAAKEIWGNATGVTRARPIFDSLQKAGRGVSREPQSIEKPGVPKQPSSIKGSERSSGALERTHNSGNSKSVSNAGSSNSTSASSGLNRLESRRRVKSLSHGARVPIASELNKVSKAIPVPPAPAHKQQRQFPRRECPSSPQNQERSQAFCDSRFSTLSGSLLTCKPEPNVPFEVCSKADVSASQASTEEPSEAPETVGTSCIDTGGPFGGLSSETLGWSSLLPASSSGYSMAIPPRSGQRPLIHRSRRTRIQRLGATDCVSAPRNHDAASQHPRTGRGLPLRLPQVELSLTCKQIGSSVAASKRPSQSHVAAPSSWEGKATPACRGPSTGAATGK